MSTPAREVGHTRWIDADQTRKQQTRRVYIVKEICRRCQDPEHGLLFSACQFEDGECVLQTIGRLLASKERGWDARFADLKIHGGD